MVRTGRELVAPAETPRMSQTASQPRRTAIVQDAVPPVSDDDLGQDRGRTPGRGVGGAVTGPRHGSLIRTSGQSSKAISVSLHLRLPGVVEAGASGRRRDYLVGRLTPRSSS